MAEVKLSLEEYDDKKKKWEQECQEIKDELESTKAELEKVNERYRCLSNGFTDYFKRFDEEMMKRIHASGSLGLSCDKCGSKNRVVRVFVDLMNGIGYNLCEKCRHSYYYQYAATNFKDVVKFISEKDK